MMLVYVRHLLGITLIVLLFGMLFLEGSQVKAESYVDELEDKWIQPVDGRITDTFGTRNGKHKGIDIAAPEGEKIVSVSDGKVTRSYYSTTYGHVVFVEHPEGYETVYAHLSKRKVDEGEVVKKGQELGVIGNTGVSSGTHLHFELHEGEWTYGKEHALDPLFVFDLPNSTVHSEQEHHHLKGNVISKEVQANTSENPQDDNQNDAVTQEKVITVKKGDTLWRLSQHHKVTVKSIQKWNKLESDVIFPGQELKMYNVKEKNNVVQDKDTNLSIANTFRFDSAANIKLN
ncbi:LysM peptidoglycan-binding domain-containing protein [Metabacillus sediminilitoris]|uniref:LysM peptidoglycan-binding domain-containing protein n=2 Tax=Metabacillus sediminilitoris TaxID=2567941 RepID=A0A4S4CAL6_9BACI|nr:peptidoglycan DD-metalloendopeptidase family protein [Metabacillus sediminilitoris]THF82882.1 LysM peptidoglycan-binding domain-containing protein [Metabacillus sediminilitoris]